MILSQEKKDLLNRIYFDQDNKRNEGAFGSAQSLYRASHAVDKSITYNIVKIYLRSIKSYISHKRVLRRFPRRSLLILFPNDVWASDLIFYDDKSVNNLQQIGAINCIDCFSKKAWSRSIGNKTAKEILLKFKEIITEASATPRKLFVDQGSEYKGVFLEYCKSRDITVYSTTTGQKSFIVENFQGTLKLKIGRILTFENNRSWVKALPRALEIYNNTKSSALDDLSPNQVWNNWDNISRVQSFLLKRRASKAKKYINKVPALKIGQDVRRIVTTGFKQRGFKPKFSDKIYQITKVISNAVPYGFNISHHGDTFFYEAELVPVIGRAHEKSSVSKKILKIISEKKIAVKWLRSGKPISYEPRYLTRTELEDTPKYLSDKEILEFDNGEYMLKKFKEG